MPRFQLLSAFLHDKKVATPFPSSRFTVHKLLETIHFGNVRSVVEYGPGDGVVTKQLLKKLPPDAIYLAIEQNKEFIPLLQSLRDPRLRVVHGNAEDVQLYLSQIGLEHADLVLASIPFTQIEKKTRSALLRDTHKIISPKGIFLVYQHIPFVYLSIKEFFPSLKIHFSPLNFPPYFIFEAAK